MANTKGVDPNRPQGRGLVRGSKLPPLWTPRKSLLDVRKGQPKK